MKGGDEADDERFKKALQGCTITLSKPKLEIIARVVSKQRGLFKKAYSQEKIKKGFEGYVPTVDAQRLLQRCSTYQTHLDNGTIAKALAIYPTLVETAAERGELISEDFAPIGEILHTEESKGKKSRNERSLGQQGTVWLNNKAYVEDTKKKKQKLEATKLKQMHAAEKK